ncbi:theronine dehydrogenase-like Zn-dependent dehydrogenase [Galbibacter orientalis DSM 19592]|uniref:Theronine dehydrogenase-like Zn-dependent dehydrogenase n=1 Tax=Galbibacter orientalis DSM 19592 TaxID=926559 RepID=I3CAW0_9FLAO|nr:zinc-binding alcohol dehydrogenase family protein [Galbibacter orientalis]EIJ40753.1 theronine dehydrogenase-like Zn-dependent dehydrogenase [Galbibacter orientalis DSM 19592]
MKYIVCEEPKKFTLKEKDIPVRKEGEVLLKITKIGICGTDLHAYAGNQAFFTYPRILGHELASHVVEVDSKSKLQKGDKVVIMPYLSCGTCIACKNGKTNCCQNIKVFGVHTDGGMQEKVVLPEAVLMPAPNLTDNEIAIIEPLAIGAHALRRASIKANDTIVVVGCGPIGIGIIKLAQIKGAKVIAIDTNENRLQYAKDTIGAEYAINALNNPADKIAEITNGDMADAVFDATGFKGALEAGVDYMAHGGSYVLVGLSKGDLTFNHPKIHAKETTLLCSRNATREDFQFVIDHIKNFPTNSFITHEVNFEDMISNFDTWLDPQNGVIKAMVNIS